VTSPLRPFALRLGERRALAASRILDVGCGKGVFVRELAAREAEVIGVDCSRAQLEVCMGAPRVGRERYLCATGELLPFVASSFDLVVLVGSLHHIPVHAMEPALREARRVTRPGGEICVFEPCLEGTHNDLIRLAADETLVRTRAREAIARAIASGWLRSIDEDELVTDLVYPDFDSLRRAVVGADSERAAAFGAREPVLRQAFESLGRRCSEGWAFSQPFRLDVLR